MSDSNIPTKSQEQDVYKTQVTLLHRAREGKDDMAWHELLTIYAPFVSKVLAGMGFRGADLDDAKQLVFIRLWKGLHNYKRDVKRAKFRTWFARLIRNTAINILRSKNREPRGSSLDDETYHQPSFISDDPVIEARVEQEWQEYVVELAMERASAKFSGHAIKVFTMSLEGQSVENIAHELQIKPNTVYILKHRVKTVLLSEIKQVKYDLEDFDIEDE